jgi:hypothetical protein
VPIRLHLVLPWPGKYPFGFGGLEPAGKSTAGQRGGPPASGQLRHNGVSARLAASGLIEAGLTGAATCAVRHRRHAVAVLAPAGGTVVAGSAASYLYSARPGQARSGRSCWMTWTCAVTRMPLRYPGDVEPVIRRWFAERPEWGENLAVQIARRPGLQQAATVPLILAFYCIIGGAHPLPELRRDLFTEVLNRMLTGRWRGDENSPPDVAGCQLFPATGMRT